MYNYDDCHWHYPAIIDIFVVISEPITPMGIPRSIKNFDEDEEDKVYMIWDDDFISIPSEEEMFRHVMES